MSRYQPIMLLAWLALLFLQILRPCCETTTLFTPHEHATDHHNTEPRASLNDIDDLTHIHHPHTAAEDHTNSIQQEPAPHCEPLSTPQDDQLVYSTFNKTLDEPKQYFVNILRRLTVFAGAISISAGTRHYLILPTYPPPYLATRRLRI